MVLTTLSGPPMETVTTAASTDTPIAIPSTGTPVVSSTLNVSGADAWLSDINVTTDLTHTWNADLQVVLTSPAGTSVTLTSNNAGSNDNVFDGTVWDDSANPGGIPPWTNNDGTVTDHTYANLTTASPLTPEEPFAAFAGEDPNGDWVMTIADTANLDGGSLDAWSLEYTTSMCIGAVQNVPTMNRFGFILLILALGAAAFVALRLR